jgi:hypothetical protein
MVTWEYIREQAFQVSCADRCEDIIAMIIDVDLLAE